MPQLLPPPLEFTDEFKQAIDMMELGCDNLFLTGKAGTGKSTLLNYFKEHTQKSAVILAPTGVAALNVGGQTIHSFFGFKPNITLELAKKAGQKTLQKSKFTQLDILIIDEISMVRTDLLDCVDIFLQTVLKNTYPFGGKQVIFIGDLYQLAPVVNAAEKQFFSQVYTSPYFFSANVVARIDFYFKIIELDKIYRQTDDQFIDLLNAIRTNTINADQLEHLNSRQLTPTDALGYVHLTGTNYDADQINRSQLAKLSTPAFVSEGKTTGKFNTKDAPTESTLTLKVGAQVMFLNNDVSGRWVNGSIGEVTSLPRTSLQIDPHNDDHPTLQVSIPGKGLVTVTPHKWPMFTYNYDEKKRTMIQESAGTFTQYPLKLSWAITIHKSQGKTFDRVILDLMRGSFAHGQAYVALSRCRSLEGLVLKYPFRKSHILMDTRIVEFLRRLP